MGRADDTDNLRKEETGWIITKGKVHFQKAGVFAHREWFKCATAGEADKLRPSALQLLPSMTIIFFCYKGKKVFQGSMSF